MSATVNCPVCNFRMVRKQTYTLAEIFHLWESVHKFSQEVITSHEEQSAETTLWICPQCQLEAFFPQVIGTDAFYSEIKDQYRENKWDFDEATKDVSGSETVVDIGCGPGFFLDQIKPQVKKVYGIEYNTAAIQLAKAKGLEILDANHIPVEFTNKFDAVVSFHVLEHIADPIEFIKKMVSYAKPGGKIIISVPNQGGPIRYIESPMNMPPHHVTHWRLKTFKTIASIMGIQLAKVAYEPLLVENHSYYTYYWLQHAFPGNGILTRITKKVFSFILDNIFKLLKVLKLEYFHLLRGQAIYVVFIKTPTTV